MNDIHPIIQDAISPFIQEQQAKLYVVPFQDGLIRVDVTILGLNKAHAVNQALRYLSDVHVTRLRVGQVELYQGKEGEVE